MILYRPTDLRNIPTRTGSVQSLIFMLCMVLFLSGANHAFAAKASVSKPELVKDIMAGITPNGSSPGSFIKIGNTLYFTASTATHGRELWKSDGTSKGTVMVKDLVPGSSSSNPQHLLSWNGMIYFTDDNGLLWKSDGTSAGTIIIRKKSQDSESISNLLLINDRLYFSLNYGQTSEFWNSDGTSEGTRMLQKKNDGFYSNLELTEFNSSIYFTRYSYQVGTELWKWDPEAGSIAMLKDIFAGQESSDPSKLLAANGLLWFTVSHSDQDEIWRTDGTAQGTFKIANTPDGDEPTYSYSESNHTLYFIKDSDPDDQELWKSDGTMEGTELVKKPTISDSGDKIYNLIAKDGFILFIVCSEEHIELWTSEGSEQTTKSVYKFPHNLYNAGEITFAGNAFYFALEAYGKGGTELWKTLRTTSGKQKTYRVQGLSAAIHLAVAELDNGSVLFSANDQIHGYELWKTKGADNRASLLKDIVGGTGSTGPTQLQPLNGGLVFTATSGGLGKELWRTEGTKSSTLLLKNIWKESDSSDIYNITTIGNETFFSIINGSIDSPNESGLQIWKTNGRAKGTIPLKTFTRDEAIVAENFIDMNGQMYFTTRLVSSTYQTLYKNGNPTPLVASSIAYVSSGVTIPPDHSIYYITNTAELWKTDGTPTGSVKLKELGSGYESVYFSDFVASTELIYFVLYSNDVSELWRSDGTEEGTKIIATSQGDQNSPDFLGGFTTVGNILYFSSYNKESGIELWKTDGTAKGTLLVKDINPSTTDYNIFPRPLAVEGNILYFRADDGSGYALWKTNGTSEGTLKVSSIDPGSTAVSYHGKLYFSSYDSSHGDELWVSDGTTTGTRMVYDITGDSGSSLNPNYLQIKVAGEKLYFSATTEKTGTELYVYNDSQSARLPVAGDSASYGSEIRAILDAWLSTFRK